jgi:RNA polymerase beta subunit
MRNGLMQVPIMLRSNYCSLADRSDKELADLGECPYDQVRGGGALVALLTVHII